MPPKTIRKHTFQIEYRGKNYYFYNWGLYAEEGNQVCEVDISHTPYAEDVEVLKVCCYMSLIHYFKGISVGRNELKTEIRELLGVRQ